VAREYGVTRQAVSARALYQPRQAKFRQWQCVFLFRLGFHNNEIAEMLDYQSANSVYQVLHRRYGIAQKTVYTQSTCFSCPHYQHEKRKKLENISTYHGPKAGQPESYQAIRGTAKKLAALLETTCPKSRERSLAMTNLEQAVMWANASIARHE
jgi:hypothetical protein